MLTFHKNINFPFHINISFRIHGKVLETVRNLNKVIVNEGYGEINYSSENPTIPHITILMGMVETSKKLNFVEERIREFCKKNLKFDYELSDPYFPEMSKEYILAGVLPRNKFHEVKLEFGHLLNGNIVYDHHGGVENPSHITLGYAPDSKFDIFLLKKGFKPCTGFAREIQICLVGKRGVCSEMVNAFDLS